MKIQAITGLYARQKAYKNNQSYYTTPLKSDSLTFSSRQRIPVYIIDPKGERKRYDCLADLIQDKKTKFNTRTAFQINFSENS